MPVKPGKSSNRFPTVAASPTARSRRPPALAFRPEITFVIRFLALRYSDYQSDVYTKPVEIYYPTRGLAVLGEGCRGVLD